MAAYHGPRTKGRQWQSKWHRRPLFETLEDRRLLSIDVTNNLNIQTSGLVYSRQKSTFSGSITVTDTDTHDLSGPVLLILHGLPQGVSLLNPTGTTPAGDPYISVGTLAMGQPHVQTIQFSDPQRTPIHYTTQAVVDSVTPNSTTFDIFTNPADSELIRAMTPDGDIIDYFGTKDANGFATSLTSATVQNADGKITRILFDSQGRPDELIGYNGIVFKIAWISDTSLRVTVIAEGGRIQGSIPAQVQSSAVPQSQVGLTAGVQSLIGTAEAPVQTSIINVTSCGQPVDGADVTVLVVPNGGILTGDYPYTVPASPTGTPGQYQVSIPVEKSNAGEKAMEICESMAGVLDIGCTGIELLTGAFGSAENFCIALAAAVALIPGVDLADVGLLPACEGSFKAMELACDTLGKSPSEGAPSLAEELCGPLGTLVDRAAFQPLTLRPTVTLPNGQVVYGSVENSTPAGLPSFNVETGNGNVQITSFSLNPPDPAAFESYVATAEIMCAAPDTTVTMSIVGTDGYTDAKIYTITGNATTTLYVPGGAQGVMDVDTITIAGGPSEYLSLVFS